MPRQGNKSELKRDRDSTGESQLERKKTRRSQRIASGLSQLPTPVTNNESIESNGSYRVGTATPPEGRPSQIQHNAFAASQLDSPPLETQPFSQVSKQSNELSDDVIDEEKEGVWGYLIPLESRFGDVMVLKKRVSCPSIDHKETDFGKARARKGTGSSKDPQTYTKEEEQWEDKKASEGTPSSGYLIGRHPECDRVLDIPTISNRHCLIFHEKEEGDKIAVLQDLSSNGTFVNESIVGRNKHRVLQDNDEITILDQTRFVFRYPKHRVTNGFRRQFRMLEQLGKGHFASVYLCVDKETGNRFAVKKFEKRPEEPSKIDNLKQEIAVLMSVSHPNVLCLKDAFEEKDGVYLVLELAPEGELFNWIIMKQKLSEEDCRNIFIQLFQGIKYLHDRGIVHRDIKPENILLIDKELSVKLADFGLAKIIGESSFTTTLCGTPSYVAPEILVNSKKRRYTKAVDVWSLGVVLYICLCGFPPFSDELNTPDNPYTLSQQIKLGRFDYPSPYWDSVGDPALDLIDKMLTVDPDERATVEECLEHPWITYREINPAMSMDSTDGLTGAIGQLDFSKRKVARERTLLSSLNSVRVSKLVPEEDDPKESVKVFEKKPLPVEGESEKGEEQEDEGDTPAKEERPDDRRKVVEFMAMGGKGDQPLFSSSAADPDSRYSVKSSDEPSKF